MERQEVERVRPEMAKERGLTFRPAKAGSAAGRWTRRSEEKVRRVGRQTRAGHARRIGGRIAGLAAWHLGWFSRAPIVGGRLRWPR